VNTMAGVRTVPRNQVRAARSFELGPAQMFAWVTLPATMPYVLTGMRIAMGNSFAAVVGAELIAAEVGLGYLITESATWMAADHMFAGMLTLGVLGLLADLAFRGAIRRYAVRYYMAG
jgi:ABC-type nitrate/sulfonate/bicarbonate transport system permease component